MPLSVSGPRRPDFDADGDFWIPEYAGNALTRFNPNTETFRRYPLPVRDALPYVVRVDRARGRIWIGTGAADAVFMFDPHTEQFQMYPLPSRARSSATSTSTMRRVKCGSRMGPHRGVRHRSLN